MNIEPLQQFFDDAFGTAATLTVTPVVGGGSCEAFAIDRGGDRWILRRAPRHVNVASAHDVLREYKILDAIKDEPVSIARPILSCDDAGVFGAPFFEEVFFRGLLLKGLARLFTPQTIARSGRRTFGVVAAIVVDGGLFGLAHGELVQLAGLAAFGMALAFISYKTGRLGMNMVSHASFNAVAVGAILLNGSGVIH